MKKLKKNLGKNSRVSNNYSDENSHGITLVALVVSIVVMLVLAGVSINAVVGDNGIITQAQSATYATSRAVLEEWINQLYVENYDEFSEYDNKMEAFLNSSYASYFYDPSKDGDGDGTTYGVESYVVDGEGHALYLIKKSALPNDIKSQLAGGDAGEGKYVNYLALTDVYGVTSDLKVYYCSAGTDTILGVSADELDKDNPARTVTLSIEFANLLGTDTTVEAQSLRSVKTLTVDSASGFTNLSELYNLTNLQEITFDGVSLSSLKGIESCSQLYYVYFKSSTCDNYSNLGKMGSRLKYLYFYNTSDDEISKLCSENYGIASYDLTNLQYFAIVGDETYICYTNEDRYGGKTINSSVSTISYLSNLSSATKSAVKYLSLQNNYLENLDALKDFNNLYLLRCEYNQLQNIDGILNITSLAYLICGYNTSLAISSNFANGSNLYLLDCRNCSAITSLSFLTNCSSIYKIIADNCDLGYGEDADTSSAMDALYALSGKGALNYLSITNNTSLVWVDYLKNVSTIRYCYLAGDSNIDSDSLSAIKSIILGCGYNYSLPDKYSFLFLDDNLEYMSLSGQTVEKSNFLLLKNKTKLSKLILTNVVLTDEDVTLSETETNSVIQEVLSTLTGMKYLSLEGLSSVTSLAFVEDMTEIVQLILTDTSIADLSILQTMYDAGNLTKLDSLVINNASSNLTAIQGVISAVGTQNTEYRSDNIGSKYSFGVRLGVKKLWQTLESCTDITSFVCSAGTGSGYNADLSKCTKLTNVYLGYTDIFMTLPYSCTSYQQNAINDYYPYLDNCTNITSVTLSITGLTQAEWGDFWSRTENCVALKDFSMTSYSVNSISSLECLKNLPENNVLENFSLTVYSKSYSSLKSLAGMDYLKNLKKLTIDKSAVSDISALEKLTSLTYISITNSSVTTVYYLRNLINLQELYLNSNSINGSYAVKEDDGTSTIYYDLHILSLLNSSNLGSLTILQLDDNPCITDTASTYYKELTSLTWDSSSSF